LPVADFEVAEPKAQRLVPETVARRFMVFPLREDDRTQAVLLGVRIQSSDKRLFTAIKHLYDGPQAYGKATQVTLVIE
jgi:phage gp37-like protein